MLAKQLSPLKTPQQMPTRLRTTMMHKTFVDSIYSIL
jgi:hypothetical protein